MNTSPQLKEIIRQLKGKLIVKKKHFKYIFPLITMKSYEKKTVEYFNLNKQKK